MSPLQSSPALDLASMLLWPRDPPASTLNDTTIDQYSCVKWDPNVEPAIHYRPSLAVGIVFCVLFGASLLAHTVQTIVSRKWWYSAFVLGGIGELIGWAGRTRMYECPYNNTLFIMQIAILVIAPCFLSAGIYYILAELIRHWGRQYSILSPKLYLWIFIGFDLLSIGLQGAGGGLASSNDDQQSKNGTHIMLAGIIVQLIAMCSFVALGSYTIWNARKLEWSRNLKLVLGATAFATICILTRNFYRAVELGEGWNGYLISHEVYFCFLDGMLMVFAVGIFNLFHPAFLLPREKVPENITRLPSDEMVLKA